MQGRPVWLASVSKRNMKLNQLIPNTRWLSWMKKNAKRALWQTLRGVGNPEIGWRMFRMNITYCLHVAVSDAELEVLGPQWMDKPGGALAGGPIEILDFGNCPTNPSVMPCENPTREPLPKAPGQVHSDQDMWFPIDCGKCDPCLDRIRIEQLVEA